MVQQNHPPTDNAPPLTVAVPGNKTVAWMAYIADHEGLFDRRHESAAKAVMLALHSIGKDLYPSLGMLATRTGSSKEKVRRGIDALIQAGFLRITEKGRAKKHNTRYERRCPVSMAAEMLGTVPTMTTVDAGANSNCTHSEYSDCTHSEDSEAPTVLTMRSKSRTRTKVEPGKVEHSHSRAAGELDAELETSANRVSSVVSSSWHVLDGETVPDWYAWRKNRQGSWEHRNVTSRRTKSIAVQQAATRPDTDFNGFWLSKSQHDKQLEDPSWLSIHYRNLDSPGAA